MSEDVGPPEPIAPDENDPRIQAAVIELKDLILRHYPAAIFTTARGEDPDGIYLTPIVDVEDLDEVAEVFTSRLVDMQVEEGLPVYVVPEWPIARVQEYLRQKATQPVEARLVLMVP
jgi:hypothetical protein